MSEGSADAKKSEKSTAEEDEELSALLESAVGDFDKTATTDGGKKEPSAKPTPPDSLWTQNAGGAPINPQFASLFSPDGSFGVDQLGQELARLAEASVQAAGLESSPDGDFSSIFAETLRNLSENCENMQGEINDEAVLNMLQNMTGSPDANSGNIMSVMRNMMQGLLSKDVLQPALTALVEKYPAWLDENRSKLPADDLARYEKQLSLMRSICADLDEEEPNDSEDVKNARFDKILENLQEMQNCGQPPAELIADQGSGLDEQTLQMLSNRPDQCVLQ